MYLRMRCCKDGCFNLIVLASTNGFCVMDLLIVLTFFDVIFLHVMVIGSRTFGRGTSLLGSALHVEINHYQKLDKNTIIIFESRNFCPEASCDHIKRVQVLFLSLHVGGGTRVGGHVHWNNKKYLKVVKTITNLLQHFNLKQL